jgi:Trk K+ transport system NAD-binding subunit
VNSVFFMALRRLRAPILYLVVVFALGIVGLALIPGVDAEGRAWRLSAFQAFYFMAYTATTIGFGEIPQPFSDAQRLWVTAMIFASVIGWAYLVGSLLALAQDGAFRAALVARGFRRAVRRLGEPFYLIAGFGETGVLVGRALDTLGQRFTVIDIDESRVQEADMAGLRQHAPALAADAKMPEHLLAAGLAQRNCRGVLALTNDDHANLAVAMSVRLLNPDVPVLARAMTHEAAANMASFGTDHIINPFAKFGGYLALAIASPGSHRLLSWLTGLPGTTLKPETAPPRGHWIVCGYGRFGREVVRAFRGHGLDVTVIDPQERPAGDLPAVRGLGTDAEALTQAGAQRSVGLVAGTDDDITNLSIAVTARELNGALFTIVRQNLQANGALFDAYHADIRMVSSEIVANECLALIHTPLLGRFLAVVREKDDAWADAVIERLQASIGEEAPEIWCVSLSASGAPAMHRALSAGGRVSIADLLRDPGEREARLACEALYVLRAGEPHVLPPDGFVLQPGDEILFAGRHEAREAQWPMLRNVNVRDYVLSGVEAPGGSLWQWLTRRSPSS